MSFHYVSFTTEIPPWHMPSVYDPSDSGLWKRSRLVWYDDVIKGKHFSRYWPFVRRIHRSPVNSPHKVQWRTALMFSLIFAWRNAWVNNRGMWHLRAHYDVTVIRKHHDDYLLRQRASRLQYRLPMVNKNAKTGAAIRPLHWQHMSNNRTVSQEKWFCSTVWSN